MSKTVFDFKVKDISGNLVDLSQFKGKHLLIVNVASQCGFTPQYTGLEEIQREFTGKVEVLGFPCNQFGKQEPGDANEIKNFCSLKYDVTFPLFAKVDVNGKDAEPLFEFLKNEKKGFMGSKFIKWNFTKFLVGPEGHVLKRYSPKDTPADIKKDLQKLV